MSNSMKRGQGILVNWYWFWLISGVFVGAMVVYFFKHHPAWFHASYRIVSLTHEMNYAVWWAGIGLFLAGIVFARVGEIAAATVRPAWPWYVLALAMLALCFDEVGSLHETVSRVGGWWGLLPFALLFAAAFGFSLFEIVRRPGFRLVTLIIVFSIGLFVAVAGLEALEHGRELLGFHLNSYLRRVRLVGEETIELLATGLLVTAGLIAMKNMGDADRRVLNVTSVVERLLDVPLVVFVLFVVQVVVTASFIVTNYTIFPEGNPAVLFSMLLFFCLGIIACLRVGPARRSGKQTGFWVLLAVLFFTASILQMYNLFILFSRVTGISIGPLDGPPITWLITVVPLLWMIGFGIRNRLLSRGGYMRPLLLLLGIFLLVYPDLEHHYRIECLYFIFSSAVAYSCYQLMGRFDPWVPSR